MARRNPNRFCITCQGAFIGPGNPFGPFYCSEACQTTRGLCQQCAKPTVHKFCSHACVDKAFPPPHTCRTCSKQFTSTKYFLNKRASFYGPPKYCSSICYQNRGDSTGQPKAANSRTHIDYDIAMKGIHPTNPYSLPLSKIGMPWIGVQPKIPQSKLHIRSQNTVRFWDLALNGYTEELSPLEYNAFLFEFVCKRSSPHPKPVELQDCWRIWPYIEQYVDDRYSISMFQQFCQNYLYARRAYFKQAGCMPQAKLDMLVRQCVSAWEQEVHPKDSTNTGPSKFAELWLRPLLHMDAPYAHPNTNRPNYKAHYSRIQLELRRVDDATLSMGSEWLHLSYLNPLTQEQYTALSELNATIMQFYTEAMYIDADMLKPRTAKYPWGPNCYPALNAAHHDDPLEVIKWEMRTTPKYNLPEMYS